MWEDQLSQAAQVPDGGWQLLDVVVAEVQPAQTLEGEHAHVYPGQLAVGHLQLLQGVGEARGQGIVLLGHNGQLLLELLHIPGPDRCEGRQRESVIFTSSVGQPGSREEVLQAVSIGLRSR